MKNKSSINGTTFKAVHGFEHKSDENINTVICHVFVFMIEGFEWDYNREEKIAAPYKIHILCNVPIVVLLNRRDFAGS